MTTSNSGSGGDSGVFSALTPRVFTAKTSKRVVFTPVMTAYERAERDGVMELDDGEVVWQSPEDGETA